MKHWLIFFVPLTLLACSAPLMDDELAEALPSVAALPDLGEAPELTNEIWLNTETPLRLVDLRGKVVLIDMWTFG